MKPDSPATSMSSGQAQPEAVDAAAHGQAQDELHAVLPSVYNELRQLAARAMTHESSAMTLRPTDLVHEAYLKLRHEDNGWADRRHFMVAASVAMRRALLDHARKRNADKRGGRVQRVQIDADCFALPGTDAGAGFGVIETEELLRKLEQEDREAAQLVELRVFGGLSVNECAEALGTSTKTVQRRWRFARAWLVSALEVAAETRS